MGLPAIIPKGIIKPVKNLMFKLNKNRPEIQLVGGVFLVVGGFVYAIVQTRKLDDTMEKTSKMVEEVESKKDIDFAEGGYSSDKEYKKALSIARTKGVWEMVKLFGPPVLVTASGLIFIINGHFVMVKRNAALAALAASWEKAYKLYDQRVRDDLGDTKAEQYRNGVIGESKSDIIQVDSDGNQKTVSKKKSIVDPARSSHPYRFVFSEEFSTQATGDPVIDMAFLKAQEEYWKHVYNGEDRITLIEVLKSLKIYIDKEDPMYHNSLIAGWDHRKSGDDIIDFGLFSAINEPALNKESDVIYVTFNCDGNLYGYEEPETTKKKRSK